MVEYNFSKLKVLVVEDNLINQKIMRAYLGKLNVEFDIAENGSVGIEFYSQSKYDCILMDIQMPELDGIEATQIIRETEKTLNASVGRDSKSYTPIIAVTASAPYEEQKKFKEIGFDYYVPKPVSLNVLTEIFRKVIDNVFPE